MLRAGIEPLTSFISLHSLTPPPQTPSHSYIPFIEIHVNRVYSLFLIKLLLELISSLANIKRIFKKEKIYKNNPKPLFTPYRVYTVIETIRANKGDCDYKTY